MELNFILNRIAEYWKLHHGDYCNKLPNELNVESLSEWIMESQSKYDELHGPYRYHEICIWSQFDEILSFILSNSNVYVLYVLESIIDWENERINHTSIKSFYGYNDKSKHSPNTDLELIFMDYNGYDIEPFCCIHFIIKSILLYVYYKPLNIIKE